MGTQAQTQKRDLSFLWLGIAVILTFISTGQWALWLAAWIGPVFMLRFTRSKRPLAGYGLAVLGSYLALVIAWRQIIPLPLPVYLIFMLINALTASLPLLIERLVSPQLKGYWATLVFPLVTTALEFFYIAGSPLGSFGASAYTQSALLPLIQLTSITGMWGITFLLAWFAGVVNWAWENEFEWTNIKTGIMAFGGVIVAILIFGTVRLLTAPDYQETFRVAGITVAEIRMEELVPLYHDDPEHFRNVTIGIHQDYLAQTLEQTQAGAQIVVWPELAGIGVEEDVQTLIADAQALAQEEGIYLIAPTFVFYPDEEDRPAENRLLLITPDGEVVIDHVKFGGNIIEGSLAGDGVLQIVETEIGTVSGVICWDSDYPGIMTQAGQNDVDVMFVPAHDWKAIVHIHADMAVFRAIENGYVLVRQAEQGMSIITDAYGRKIVSMNHFTASERVMVAEIPAQSVSTIYGKTGDWFGMLCGLGFIATGVWAVIRWRFYRSQEILAHSSISMSG